MSSDRKHLQEARPITDKRVLLSLLLIAALVAANLYFALR